MQQERVLQKNKLRQKSLATLESFWAERPKAEEVKSTDGGLLILNNLML